MNTLIFEDGEVKDLKLRAGKILVPNCKCKRRGDRLYLSFRYNAKLLDEVKTSFNDRKWDPDTKTWHFPYNEHNIFQLSYLACLNPYERYNAPLIEATSKRPLKKHQYVAKSHIMTRRQCIVAAEMGLGKTLSAIEGLEYALEVSKKEFGDDQPRMLWVGPKQTLSTIELELERWNAIVRPPMISYSSLEKYLKEWDGKKAPFAVVFDESNKLKTETSKRTQAARYLVSCMREEYGDDCFIIEMCGTPAPKSPLDWYSQCEIACPGYLKEGSAIAFKYRLAIIQDEQNLETGGMFPKLVSWRDDDKKCEKCGKYAEHSNHLVDHQFIAAKNEVHILSQRHKGLVLVQLKKDCLDLPDKHYRIIECPPTKETLRAAKLIKAKSSRAITALTLMRELSDGFQYDEKVVGTTTCDLCNGSKTVNQPEYIGPAITEDFLLSLGVEPSPIDPESDNTWQIPINPDTEKYFEMRPVACPHCDGTGAMKTYERTTIEVKCPKDQVVKDILDDHEDIGRLVIYAGFTGSVDRCMNIVAAHEWSFIRVDGRGWFSNLPGDQKDLLKRFQDKSDPERICFIGHPGAAGMGLTLTASPTILYYSNTFNGDERVQSEDRVHRIGMDIQRGANIIDIFHLPTDKYVWDNIKKKRDLQRLSLGELESFLEKAENDSGPRKSNYSAGITTVSAG